MVAASPLETYIRHLARAPGKRLPSKLDVVIDGHSVSVSAAYGILSYVAQSGSIQVERISASGPGALLGCLFLLGAFGDAEFNDLLLAAPRGLRTAALLQYTAEYVRAAPVAHVVGLSEKLIISYNDLRHGAPAIGLRFPTKDRLLRMLARTCRLPGITGHAAGPRFCGGAAPRLVDDPSRATLLIAANHPIRRLAAALLPTRTDSLSGALDAVADAHSFFSGQSSLTCSYYVQGTSVAAAWMGVRARLIAFLCGLVYRRQRAHLSQSEKEGEG